MHVSEMPEGLIRAAFSAAEGVSEHSVVKISTKNSEEPFFGRENGRTTVNKW